MHSQVGATRMKKITVTFEVTVPDNPVFEGNVLPDDVLMMDLYDHVCQWVMNTEGTVEFTNESIT